MKSQTNELALEMAIEKALTGSCREELETDGGQVQSSPSAYDPGNGFLIGLPEHFNAAYALDEVCFWSFLEETQPLELNKIKRQADWKPRIIQQFDKMIKKYGLLSLLKKGLQIDDAQLYLFYELPLASSSRSVHEKFEQNRFSVTRQVRYNTDNPNEEIDMVVFVNGIPLATLELKNLWTGQNARVHGVRQYKFSRDFNQPLLKFGRCLVHFAADPDEVYMTTKLNGSKTFFLPFNKGCNNGKGNPPNPFGHKSDYLWKEVFTRHSLANIIQHFVRFDGKPKDKLHSRTLFFPRYHQLDVVRKLITSVSEKGVGQTYLIQHSAGSGKSNSITWLAYQLIEAYPKSEHIPGARALNSPLFDSVIVVTDKRILDKQLRENIRDFSSVKNIIAPAHNSADLKRGLEQGKRIIITTIQKFPFIVDGIADLSHKRFAVIIDEAHSSQGGTTAGKMNEAMGHQEDADDFDYQEKILQAIQARKMKGNASYFAFTATPKNATLEKFGVKQPDGSFKPFHLYSMKQAIEEGFILDVLANYTTYKSYYEIEKSIEENPLFDTRKAQNKLRNHVERNPRTIATKAEIMMEHFTDKVYKTKKLKGVAKAMVVTQNIISAIVYYQALNRILKDKGNPFKILIAFSGKKAVDGIEYTEADMNGFSERETRDNFDKDEYRILVVANKYLTGFDQPKLCTMYVDKKLQGVIAVQALSRLNRSAAKYGKKTEDLFVLDFFNQVDDIKKSFDPFYTSTSLSEPTDVNVLHELKSKLDEYGVYESQEVEDFVEKYFKGVDAQQLSPVIDKAAARFNSGLELGDTEKADFKIKAKQFVKIYSQVASILQFEVAEWEKLYWMLKFLIPKLIVVDKEGALIDDLLESVDLSTYGLERTKANVTITLSEDDGALDPQNPNPRGAHDTENEEDTLDEIVATFNARFFQGWDATPEDQRIKFIQVSQKIRKHPDFETKYLDNPDEQNRNIAFDRILKEVLAQQRKQELELYRLSAKDESFYQAFAHAMKRMVDHPKLR